jgi:hypothetical protein
MGRVRPPLSLVPRARWLGWSREPAATTVVTGAALIPFGSVLQSCRSRAHSKAWPQMNIKRQHGVSEITGVTGMAMIRAIRAGARNPITLAQRSDDRCHQD